MHTDYTSRTSWHCWFLSWFIQKFGHIVWLDYFDPGRPPRHLKIAGICQQWLIWNKSWVWYPMISHNLLGGSLGSSHFLRITYFGSSHLLSRHKLVFGGFPFVNVIWASIFCLLTFCLVYCCHCFGAGWVLHCFPLWIVHSVICQASSKSSHALAGYFKQIILFVLLYILCGSLCLLIHLLGAFYWFLRFYLLTLFLNGKGKDRAVCSLCSLFTPDVLFLVPLYFRIFMYYYWGFSYHYLLLIIWEHPASLIFLQLLLIIRKLITTCIFHFLLLWPRFLACQLRQPGFLSNAGFL